MNRTTIQIPQSTRNKLREARKPHESNYGQTIERLLGNANGGDMWTEQEIRDLADEQIRDARKR